MVDAARALDMNFEQLIDREPKEVGRRMRRPSDRVVQRKHADILDQQRTMFEGACEELWYGDAERGQVTMQIYPGRLGQWLLKEAERTRVGGQVAGTKVDEDRGRRRRRYSRVRLYREAPEAARREIPAEQVGA